MSITVNAIPQSLKNRDQWICWYTEMRDGKETKIPADPRDGTRASTTDESTWGSIADAISAYQTTDRMKGIGFVFTDSDPFVGVDIDDCRDPDEEEWEPWAIDILHDLSGFKEISPSGTGAHGIVKAEIPGDRNRRGDVEMYETARYFTMTGDVVDENGDRIDGTPSVVEEQRGLDSVYDQFLAGDDDTANDVDVDVDLDGDHIQSESGSPSSAPGGGNIDALPPEDQERLKKAKGATGNGYKFTKLWRGDWQSVYPGESHSEADMGFCDMLAFWFEKDPKRMDRVFRASGLMRDKWDEKHYSDGSTYGERTIERAISQVDDSYDDNHYSDNERGDEDEDEDEDEDGSVDKQEQQSNSPQATSSSTGEETQSNNSVRESKTEQDPRPSSRESASSSRTRSRPRTVESAETTTDEVTGSNEGTEKTTNDPTEQNDDKVKSTGESDASRTRGKEPKGSIDTFSPVGVEDQSVQDSPDDSGESGSESDMRRERGDDDEFNSLELDSGGDEGNSKTGGGNSTRGANIEDSDRVESEDELDGIFTEDAADGVEVDVEVEEESQESAAQRKRVDSADSNRKDTGSSAGVQENQGGETRDGESIREEENDDNVESGDNQQSDSADNGGDGRSTNEGESGSGEDNGESERGQEDETNIVSSEDGESDEVESDSDSDDAGSDGEDEEDSDAESEQIVRNIRDGEATEEEIELAESLRSQWSSLEEKFEEKTSRFLNNLQLLDDKVSSVHSQARNRDEKLQEQIDRLEDKRAELEAEKERLRGALQRQQDQIEELESAVVRLAKRSETPSPPHREDLGNEFDFGGESQAVRADEPKSPSERFEGESGHESPLDNRTGPESTDHQIESARKDENGDREDESDSGMLPRVSLSDFF